MAALLEMYMMIATFYVGCGGRTVTFPVNQSALRRTLRDHFTSRRSYLDFHQKKDVQQYIKGIFSNLAADTYYITFEEQQFEALRQDDRYEMGINYMLTMKGSDYGTVADSVCVLGAHYDTREGSPGVDNNGSGMAAVLEIARLLVAHRQTVCSFTNTLIIVAFDWQEGGSSIPRWVSGSQAFVNQFLPKTMSASKGVYRGAIILDTILHFNMATQSQALPEGFGLLYPDFYRQLARQNFAGNFLLLLGRRPDVEILQRLYNISASFPGLADLARNAEMPLVLRHIRGRPSDDLPPMIRNMLSGYPWLLGGDHAAFWEYRGTLSRSGLRAVLLTDTANLRAGHCYQQACDDVRYVTDVGLRFMVHTCQVVANMLLETLTDSNSECSDTNMYQQSEVTNRGLRRNTADRLTSVCLLLVHLLTPHYLS